MKKIMKNHENFTKSGGFSHLLYQRLALIFFFLVSKVAVHGTSTFDTKRKKIILSF